MRCGRIDALQIVVQGKLGQRFPGRGEGVYFHWIDPAATVASSSDAPDAATTTRRRLAMPDRTGSDQRDALHGTKAQLPSVLCVFLIIYAVRSSIDKGGRQTFGQEEIKGRERWKKRNGEKKKKTKTKRTLETEF